MRGRKPTPTQVKILRGNPGRRPLNEGEPQPAPLAPSCPPELSPTAKDEWNRIIVELVELGLMPISTARRSQPTAKPTQCGPTPYRRFRSTARS